jgi:hypothetical protein
MNTHGRPRPGQPSYFLGRPASRWIDALSRRRRTKAR